MLLINFSRQNDLFGTRLKYHWFIIIDYYTSSMVITTCLQGLSGAFIMPSTLAIINEYYIGKERQRALSFWSIGSWGGSGICSLFGGFIASTIDGNGFLLFLLLCQYFHFS